MRTEDLLTTAVASLLSGDLALLPVVAEHIRSDPNGRSLAILDKLSDDLKVQILQQFFQYVAQETHKTTFDRLAVSSLLERWYGIDLARSVISRPARSNLPGRDTGRTYSLAFGGTKVFMYMSKLKASAAEQLVDVVATKAVLTTEATSPPCELAEFVPLWLQNRDQEPGAYYLAGQADGHPIQDYFDEQVAAIRATLGVTITQRSTENGRHRQQ